jgi:ribonuclease J
MISFTFYGGAGEVGGNKILLRYGGAKTYLDFGESFDFGSDYFYEWLEPRTINGLECYFEFGLLPKIPRLYSRPMLQFTDLEYEAPDIDGVIISHHHCDHIRRLAFLDETIPIHLGHGTKAIIADPVFPYVHRPGREDQPIHDSLKKRGPKDPRFCA